MVLTVLSPKRAFAAIGDGRLDADAGYLRGSNRVNPLIAKIVVQTNS